MTRDQINTARNVKAGADTIAALSLAMGVSHGTARRMLREATAANLVHAVAFERGEVPAVYELTEAGASLLGKSGGVVPMDLGPDTQADLLAVDEFYPCGGLTHAVHCDEYGLESGESVQRLTALVDLGLIERGPSSPATYSLTAAGGIVVCVLERAAKERA